MLVLSEPVEGREAEYDDWYTNTHLGEVVATDGFVAAQRFGLVHGEGAPHGHLAVYEVEGDLETARAALAAGKEQRVPVPDTMSPERRSWWFTAVSDRVEAAEPDE